jgi:hypothetical protein
VTASTASQQALQQADAPARPNEVKLRFEVVAGVHRGAVLLLDETHYRIGSSPEADIVLSDAGVAPQHAVLHVKQGIVRIGATGAEITVGQEPLPILRGCRVKLPVSIALGAAQIHLSDPSEGREPDHLLLLKTDILEFLETSIPKTPAAAVVLVLVFLAAVAALSHIAGSSGVRASAPAITGPSSEKARNPSGLAAEDAVRALNARLDAAGIKTLRINTENGRLAATGTLTRQEATVWAAVQQWFDQTYGGRIVLTTRIDPPGATRALPALQLQAIWYGEHPYILTADGEHYFLGAVLDNGWIVREIGEDRVLLAKDGETVALTYR